MKLILPIALLLVLSACKITEKNIPGTYQPDSDRRTRLVLHEDKTFELALLNPLTDLLLSNSGNQMNYFTTGSWQYEKKKLVLKTFVAGQQTNAGGINDSITRFTNISSINFWNRYGDPVSIRSILLPPAKPKPYFGNSLYFFSQDFKQTDTLKFYFDGYPPFSLPGSVPSAIGNNIHKVTLQEPYRPTAFPELGFIVKKNKLISTSGKLKFEKKL